MLWELVVFSFFLFFTWAFLTTRKPHGAPPGPACMPFVGNHYQLKKLAKKLGGQHLAFQYLAKLYNSDIISLKLGGDYTIIVNKYDGIREVLFNDIFDARPISFFIQLRSMGTCKGITCTEGAFWQIQRSFLVRHLRDLGLGKAKMDFMILEEMNDIVESLEESKTVRIGPLLGKSVVNILWAMIAGNRIAKSDPEKIDQFQKLLAERSRVFDMSGGLLTQMPWLRYIIPDAIGYSIIVNLNNKLRKFFMETITEHEDTWYEGRDDDFMYSFISEMRKGQDSTFTVDQLMMVCLDVFLAGAHTTSNSIDFALLMMVLYPDVQEKLQAVLDKVFPDPKKPIEYKDRNLVPYVEAVLFETERFVNVAPLTGPRRALSDTDICGQKVPKGTVVIMNNYCVHSSKEIWGDPEVFRPERFLNDNGDVINSKYLLVFNKGRRRCLGEVLARACVFTFFAGIMKNFKVGVKDGTANPTGKPVTGILSSTEPWIAKFTKR